MTREEAKRLLPIIKAFSDGKTLQYRVSPSIPRPDNRDVSYLKEWVDLDEDKFDGFCFDGTINYRIKPETKYRPFKTKEECWNEMMKHQPFGWVKDTSNKASYSILEVTNEGCVFAYGPVMPFDDIYKYHTFADGKPFGIKEF